MAESGQSDRIPRTEATVAVADTLEWFGGLYSRSGFDDPAVQAEAFLAALSERGYSVTRSAAPPEPHLTAEALRTLEHEVIRLCHPKDVGPIADLFARARRSQPWGGAAPDRLPSVDVLARAITSKWRMFKKAGTRTGPTPLELSRAILNALEAELASLHEEPSSPDGGGEGE